MDSNVLAQLEAQQNVTPVASDIIVVAAPQQESSRLSTLCGILGNLDHAVIAIKATIDSEAEAASREKKFADEKSAWKNKRERGENGFEQRKQKLEQDKVLYIQEHQQLMEEKMAHSADKQYIKGHFEAAETFAQREAKLANRIQIFDKECESDKVSRLEKNEQIRKKFTKVMSREEAVKARESKVKDDERSVKKREDLVARREAEANAWQERLRKDERRIDIKMKSIRMEDEARKSRQNSLNELNPSRTSDPSILISQSSLLIPNTSNKPRPISRPIKQLELSGGKSFESLFSLAGKGVSNAGTYYERKPQTVKFMPNPTIGEEDYLAVRTLQPLNIVRYTIEYDSLVVRILPEVVFVEGTKEEDVLQTGSHIYTVFKEFGVSKYLDNRPELVSHEGKLYICWYLYKKFLPW